MNLHNKIKLQLQHFTYYAFDMYEYYGDVICNYILCLCLDYNFKFSEVLS